MDPILSIVGLVVVAGVLLIAVDRWRKRRLQRRRDYIRNYDFPAGLDRKLSARYPHLGPGEIKQVFTGLRHFFLLSLDARRRMVAMPSQAVDVLWHEFILYTRNYERFCRDSFGTFLHHTPAVEMGGNQQRRALRRAWRMACRLESLSLTKPSRLPLLFGLDAQLRIADGYHYVLDCSSFRSNTGRPGQPWCAAVLIPPLGSVESDGGCGGDSDGNDSGSSGCGGGCGGGGGD